MSKSTIKSNSATWYTGLIAIVFVGMLIWVILALRVDIFSEKVKEGEPLSILIVIDDGQRPLISQILVLHPRTLNAALIAVPVETGMLLEGLDRVDRLEVVYDPSDTSDYENLLGILLGEEIDFIMRFHTSNFEQMVDYLGGIDIFIPNAIDEQVNGIRYLFPSGVVRLDGDKSASYIQYRSVDEAIFERSERERRVIQSLLRALRLERTYILSSKVFKYISSIVDWQGDSRSLHSFMEKISMVDSDRITFQGILGSKRQLDGKYVLFPYYDAKLIKETVQRIRESLLQSNEFGNEALTIKVEILNGTGINGFATRTAHLFRSYGFRVVSVSNAKRNDYDRTVILDRQGKPGVAKRVADLVGSEQIHSQISEVRDETIDVTIILGKDFDGRYVKR